MTEEKIEDWLGCPGAVKAALPGKIEKAVQYALDECFLEMVGTPEAQRDKWLYKEIKVQICSAMQGWIKEAIDDAIGQALKK
jgi:hypothetical protein